jgi:pyruvate,water dikinase
LDAFVRPEAGTSDAPTAEGPAARPSRSRPALQPQVIDLDDPRAVEPGLTGAKASNLAIARRAGLPVLPGLVVTTAVTDEVRSTGQLPEVLESRLRSHLTRRGWEQTSLVARSSSTVEDLGESSMAGQFDSLLDLQGWDALAEGVVAVARSADRADLDGGPIAVLIQPFLPTDKAGVMFGADPVRHDADHIVVAATDQGADALVSGTVEGETTILSQRGRHASGAPLDRRTRRLLTDLAHRLEERFGGPQDVEWAIDAEGTLHLLQTRPITTPVHHPVGPRFGPGPVAETFPVPLTPLEQDLWIGPLRAGLEEAILVSGTVGTKERRRSSVVTTVHGNVAVDLDLLDPSPPRGLRRLDPVPPIRRLRAAWRVGRLRVSLPALATDLVREVDTDLAEVPPLGELSDRRLLGLFQRTGEALGALHGYEVLAGLLLDVGTAEVTGASLGLDALSEGRRLGESDEQLIAARPVVLSLLPPQIGPPPVLPDTPPDRGPGPEPTPCDECEERTALQLAALAREALRVRVRWVQELQARTAWELGQRLVDRGRLPRQKDVRWLWLGELVRMVDGAGPPSDLMARREDQGPPLPAAFQLSAEGEVVISLDAGGAGQGAGGGLGEGEVHVGGEGVPDGAVLVVRTLDPNLAPLLPRLGGLVAETGSPLSHLAILAREHRVPTVVGKASATTELQDGQRVRVDGDAGTVDVLDADDAPGGTS